MVGEVLFEGFADKQKGWQPGVRHADRLRQQACVGLGRHAQGFGKHVQAWAAKQALFGQMGEFLGTQASVARTRPEGRGLADVRTCGRPETVRCAWALVGVKCAQVGRAVSPRPRFVGDVGRALQARGP